MKRVPVILAILAFVGGGLFGVSRMHAQQAPLPVNDKPFTEKWAPTEWGPNDKVGAPNRTTPAIVMKAVALVKQGKTATLGKLYHSSIPAFGARGWNMTIPGTPTGGPFGKNALVYHDGRLFSTATASSRYAVVSKSPCRISARSIASPCRWRFSVQVGISQTCG